MLNEGASYYTIKKCLFYLIEYGMISYNGEKRVDFKRDEGWKLLSHINGARRIWWSQMVMGVRIL